LREHAKAYHIAVVIALKHGNTAVVLPSLKEQSYDKPFEIIVVEGGNRSQARNIGIAQSNAPLVAFTDADCEATMDWLAKLTVSLPHDIMVAGAGGVSSSQGSSPKLENAIDGAFSTYIGNLGSPSLISLPKPTRSFVRALSGHNSIFRRSALTEVGGFDERFQLNEDTDICARLRQKGYKLLLDQEIFIYHRRRGSLIEFARQFFSYGVGRMRSMLTTSRCVDKRIVGLFLVAILFASLALVRPMLFLCAVTIYLAVILASSITGAKRIHAPRLVPRIILCFLIEHLIYLIGMICGIFLGPWKEARQPRPAMRIHRYLVVNRTIQEEQHSSENAVERPVAMIRE
jgi:GT2 family glycosyltransferase